ncbi:hypothetical protein NC797_06780 [Aquibacillus sp. 3ASR75-11]|uniref:Uncharacterized protein n=1 Tax=Terrihalobacillus insolitus TaxID=2950438 RepID=A0A9X4ALG1_9BACI|nr:CBO0543 family protein [Terrihalobacillus insolitus]MDC3414676.1 hypothetical protein [Terrihalobacillus insolitus]MDC3424211.1 hypothetical protein [Terrihalobacillus insolitus]
MSEEQRKLFEEVNMLQERLTQDQMEYWQVYSNIDTWQFWIVLFMLLLPLVVLYYTIDRRRMFHLGFYGFNVHAWFAYTDIVGVQNGWWNYPYQILAVLPSSFSLDASLVPVSFMLIYQWTLNHNKNFHLYSILLAIIYSFAIKPFLTSIGLFELGDGVSYFHLLIGYLGIYLFAWVITKIFLKMNKANVESM